MMSYWKSITLFGIKSVLISKKEFHSKLVYNKVFLKAKIKSHGDEVTAFYDTKIPNVDFSHTCLAIISLDSPLKKNDSYC